MPEHMRLVHVTVAYADFESDQKARNASFRSYARFMLRFSFSKAHNRAFSFSVIRFQGFLN
jgi:hypothetical protein